MLSASTLARCIAARRAFARAGYVSYAQAGFDGNYVTPYHMTCGNPAGPVLISYNWIDAPSAARHKDTLKKLGYLPSMLFNRVLDRALELARLSRADIYLTHAFHLLPATRSAVIPARDVEASFDAITRKEVANRQVTALGRAAAAMCRRFAIPHVAVPHPSARGLTLDGKARDIARTLPGAAS